jgi:hypothetical protein
MKPPKPTEKRDLPSRPAEKKMRPPTWQIDIIILNLPGELWGPLERLSASLVIGVPVKMGCDSPRYIG